MIGRDNWDGIQRRVKIEETEESRVSYEDNGKDEKGRIGRNNFIRVLFEKEGHMAAV